MGKKVNGPFPTTPSSLPFQVQGFIFSLAEDTLGGSSQKKAERGI